MKKAWIVLLSLLPVCSAAFAEDAVSSAVRVHTGQGITR